MVVLISALVTIMNYANLGISMTSFKELIISLLSISGITLGSILYMVKTLSEMSGLEFWKIKSWFKIIRNK